MSILELIFIPFFEAIYVMSLAIPRLVFPESFIVAMESFVDLVSGIGFFIPLGTLTDITLLYITWYFVKLGMKIFMFLIRKIPILNIN